MSQIDELRATIRRFHEVDSTHVETVPVKESFQGKTVWEGLGEVFHLHGHPKAEKAYAWMHETDDPKKPKRHVTVLHLPPVSSAIEAVRAVIVKDFHDQEPQEN